MTLSIDHASINGIKIRYGVSVGDNKKLPLLICNGIGQSIETLEPLVERFPRRTIVAFDAPGAGCSDVPRFPLSMTGHSAVARGLLDKLEYAEVDIMGISWGGATAQQIVRDYPHRCRKLILAITCSGGITLIPGSFRVPLEMAIPTRYLSERRRRKALSMIYGGDALGDPDIITRFAARNRRPSLYGYYSQLLGSGFWTSIHWLHKIDHPTLVISGEEDPLIPPINQKLLARLIPNSMLKTYTCGHLVTFTRGEQVAADVGKFLDFEN